MIIEVVVVNRSGNPSVEDVQEALEKKYSIKIAGGMPGSTFDYEKG